MAYKAYRPYKPDFRTVTKLRGKSADPAAIANRPPALDQMKSIYTKDYSRQQNRNQHAGDLGGHLPQPVNAKQNRNLKEWALAYAG